MSKQYTEEFNKDTVRYWKEHLELGCARCAKNFGIEKSTLSIWRKLYDANGGKVPTRGRGNYESDEAKEIVHLKKELRDTQDSLDILKKAIGILEKYMKGLGIRAQYLKPYTVTTIGSDFSHELKNILNGEFNPVEPDAVWCSDITYIWTYEGFVYLTSIMDLYSRKILAWVLSDALEAKWVIEAVNRARYASGIKNPKMIHSDRGIQYVCTDYRESIKGAQRSYSKKAYPWDNACIESFHALIKREWLN